MLFFRPVFPYTHLHLSLSLSPCSDFVHNSFPPQKRENSIIIYMYIYINTYVTYMNKGPYSLIPSKKPPPPAQTLDSILSYHPNSLQFPRISAVSICWCPRSVEINIPPKRKTQNAKRKPQNGSRPNLLLLLFFFFFLFTSYLSSSSS